ncbi:uncharacterized protein LOC116770240 [Danaus plexippus]|uniref:Uncharacterized protein n=1 Tax=Danaus plexippus plexippus TaxID=278856 RepID=A0A212F382_DANPL|nr:uncharacterized protein LOC116770240 [Danaus plexippus]OWR48198.1 hypothetical protein KGM_203426 [Danaus plexippus plexippus]
MNSRASLALVVLSAVVVTSLPPPHPAVVDVRHAEEQLPPHLRSPALSNPHFLETLQLTSLLHKGEKPVFERQSDTIPRKEIYNILTHAGFIGRKRYINHLPSKHYSEVQTYHNDIPFGLNSDILQYL